MPAQQRQGENQDQREDAACQHADLQAVAGLLGNQADQAGAEGAAQVPGHGQQGEERRAAAGQPGRRDADGSRPHDSYGETAEDTACQPRRGSGGEGGQQVTAQAENS